jgi:hypothetical protein
LSVLVGAAAKRRGLRAETHDESDLGLVINASLTLLALIIGFSFSMAISRYDQRKSFEEEEANSIGTEYLRLDLLPGGAAGPLRPLMRQYLDQRILYYTVRDQERLAKIADDTTLLQNQMWGGVQRSAAAQPTPTVALAVAGMNNMLDSQGYTEAAWDNRIPIGAWCLMGALAVCCCLLVGYGSHGRGKLVLAVLPFIVSVAFFLIADIESPRHGMIRVHPHNLESLAASLGKQ